MKEGQTAIFIGYIPGQPLEEAQKGVQKVPLCEIAGRNWLVSVGPWWLLMLAHEVAFVVWRQRVWYKHAGGPCALNTWNK
jgi:hypothetical protein